MRQAWYNNAESGPTKTSSACNNAESGPTKTSSACNNAESGPTKTSSACNNAENGPTKTSSAWSGLVQHGNGDNANWRWFNFARMHLHPAPLLFGLCDVVIVTCDVSFV